MVDLKTLDWEEIKKITEAFPSYSYPSGCIFEAFWKDGIESHALVYQSPNSPNQVYLENVSDIADYLKVETKYFYTPIKDKVYEGIIFRFDEFQKGLRIAYNEEIMGHSKLIYGRVYLGQKSGPFIVFDSQAEAEKFKKKKDWEKMKEGLRLDEEFLADPWKEYRSKKKRFEEKLKKVEEATKKKIKDTEERVKELEKMIDDLEQEFLSELGVKKK